MVNHPSSRAKMPQSSAFERYVLKNLLREIEQPAVAVLDPPIFDLVEPLRIECLRRLYGQDPRQLEAFGEAA